MCMVVMLFCCVIFGEFFFFCGVAVACLVFCLWFVICCVLLVGVVLGFAVYWFVYIVVIGCLLWVIIRLFGFSL